MEASEVLLKKAEILGLRAPVDVVPDPTSEGFEQWKGDWLPYFGCAIDSFLDKNHVPMMTDDMREAMKKALPVSSCPSPTSRFRFSRWNRRRERSRPGSPTGSSRSSRSSRTPARTDLCRRRRFGGEGKNLSLFLSLNPRKGGDPILPDLALDQGAGGRALP